VDQRTPAEVLVEEQVLPAWVASGLMLDVRQLRSETTPSSFMRWPQPKPRTVFAVTVTVRTASGEDEPHPARMTTNASEITALCIGSIIRYGGANLGMDLGPKPPLCRTEAASASSAGWRSRT
jgi:hypothetical protein